MKPGDKFDLGCGAELTVLTLDPPAFRIKNADPQVVFARTVRDWESDMVFAFKPEALQALITVFEQFLLTEVPHGRIL